MLKSNWNVKVNGKGYSASDIEKKLWASRGIKDPQLFLEPRRDSLISAIQMRNIDRASDVLLRHMCGNHGDILIYADTDTDGCTAAAILYHYLRKLDVVAGLYINKGKDHGIQDYFECPPSVDLIVIVDSINDNYEVYKQFIDQGIDIIVLDHHIVAETLMPYIDKINLVSSAVFYPNPHLSGSGVVWKFINYMDFKLGYNYADEFADLAATGIIADVCSVGPQSMENRYICNLGFCSVNNLGLRTLVGSDTMNSESVSFSVAPLVNAANRMDANELALRLFTETKQVEVKSIIKELTKIKEKQKKIVAEQLPILETQVDNQKENTCYFFIVDDTCHNLAGLIATKLSDKYKRPCIVLHKSDEYQCYAGSMRAVGVENFTLLTNNSGLAECKGHENAAGIQIPYSTFDAYRDFLKQNLTHIDTSMPQTIDLHIERMQITPFLIMKLSNMNRISGADFPPFNVLIDGVVNYAVKQMSQGKHLCVEVPDMKFLYWNFNDWAAVKEDGTFSAFGTLNESFFGGKRGINLIIEDFNFESSPQKRLLW